MEEIKVQRKTFAGMKGSGSDKKFAGFLGKGKVSFFEDGNLNFYAKFIFLIQKNSPIKRFKTITKKFLFEL